MARQCLKTSSSPRRAAPTGLWRLLELIHKRASEIEVGVTGVNRVAYDISSKASSTNR